MHHVQFVCSTGQYIFPGVVQIWDLLQSKMSMSLLKYGNFGATFYITTGTGLNFCFHNNKHTAYYTKWREWQWVMLSVFEILAQIALISALRNVTPSGLLHGLTCLKT